MSKQVEEKKETFYKVVDNEYPFGVFFENKADALEHAQCSRVDGLPAYTRAVKMTRKEFEKYPEL